MRAFFQKRRAPDPHPIEIQTLCTPSLPTLLHLPSPVLIVPVTAAASTFCPVPAITETCFPRSSSIEIQTPLLSHLVRTLPAAQNIVSSPYPYPPTLDLVSALPSFPLSRPCRSRFRLFRHKSSSCDLLSVKVANYSGGHIIRPPATRGFQASPSYSFLGCGTVFSLLSFLSRLPKQLRTPPSCRCGPTFHARSAS